MWRQLSILWPLALLPALLAQAPKPPTVLTPRAKKEKLQELYRSDAAGYSIRRRSPAAEQVELRPVPVYLWTNVLRNGGQDGAVFVWTCQGRAEVVGTIFSSPPTGEKEIIHELHSLSLYPLEVERPGPEGWAPAQAGITLKPIPDAPAPATTAALRLAQMRTLTHGFSCTTEDQEGRHWELRLLPQPFYRYDSTDPEVTDGAVFSFVTSAGTDPEALLILEARRDRAGDAPTWRFAITRFTDLQLLVKYRGTSVFSAPLIPYGTRPDPTGAYRLFGDRTIPPFEGEPASTRGHESQAQPEQPSGRDQP